MNKVVNINLSGLVFSIDELAYEKLKSYLDGLKQHFAGTEGAAEITADIEARIAELLQAKLTDKQTVIQLDDVKEVIALMGDPRQIDGKDEEPRAQQQKQQNTYATSEPLAVKKLRRDPNHKTLGGVCAGLANYFGVDMIIPRMLFLVALFGYGSGFLLYILLWIVIPEANAAEVSQEGQGQGSIKRLFRNPEDKTLGGVCSGIAEYIGIDAVWLRIAFLVALFIFGTGFLAYIILWIAVPLAKTSAEKLQMKGHPVDVSNIEKTVRDNIGRSGSAQHKAADAFTTIVGGLFKFIGKAIGAFLLILSVFVIGGLIFVWTYSFGDILDKLDVTAFYGYFKYGFAMFSISIAALILLSGVKLLFHTRLKIKLVTLILFITMIIGIGLMLSFGLQYKQSVTDKQTLKENVVTAICPDTLYIQATPQAGEENLETTTITINGRRGDRKYKVGTLNDLVKIFYNTRLVIKPAKGDSLQLILNKSARGESELSALANARDIKFNASLNGNVLTIDRGILMDNDAAFKFQKVVARLKVPVGTIIKVDKHVMQMINSDFEEDFDMGETFRMNEQNLRCLDCMDTEDEADEDMNIDWNMDEEDGDIHIKIGKDGSQEVSIETNVPDSTGKSKRIEVKKVGPVTIEKEIEVK